MNPSAIWTVSTIGLHKDRRVETRTWGYYFAQDEAIAGMHECVDTEAGYYTHVIIECFTPGIYTIASNPTWFVWRQGKRKWVPCKVPKSEHHVINYGMG